MELIESILPDVIIITTYAGYVYVGLWFTAYLIRRLRRAS